MLAELIPKIAGQFQQEERIYYPRPSLSGPVRCKRQLVYNALGVAREPLPGRTLLVFDDGNWHEELTFDWLAQSVYKVHSRQMPVSLPVPNGIKIPARHCPQCKQDIPENTWHFHIDGILTDPLGQDYLWEHKAINHFTWTEYQEGKQIPLDNLTQLAHYFDGIQRALQPELCRGGLLLKNKMTAGYLEILCTYKSDRLMIDSACDHNGESITFPETHFDFIVENSFKKFLDVQKHAEEKTLPIRQYGHEDWQCQYCGWAGKCWADYENELANFDVDAALGDEILTAAKHYVECREYIKNLDGEKKAAHKVVMDLMTTQKVKSGKAGGYSIGISTVNTPAYIKNVAANSYDKLDIRKLKPKGEKKCKK